MNEKRKQLLLKAIDVCEGIAKAITLKNNGKPFCNTYCPGEDLLASVLNQLIVEIKDIEPECSQRLIAELQNIKGLSNKCVNPFSFGAVVAIVNILRMKYINVQKNEKKIFISHSSLDKTIVNGFVKEVLKIGCGFKDDEIFCTLDPTSIRTGNDFREKIIMNMKDCDYILLFISENYNLSDICKNEMGAAWVLKDKRVLPFIFPGVSFEQMGFLNVVKQGASIIDKRKLDEFYDELCECYNIHPDWPGFNKAKEEFIELITQ